jgi:hypothetical protein
MEGKCKYDFPSGCKFNIEEGLCGSCRHYNGRNYKRLYDLEHRRRVAAERYLKSIEYIHGNTPLQEPHRRDEWQSIIKEAGE